MSKWAESCGIDQIHQIRSQPAINKIGSGLDALIIFCIHGGLGALSCIVLMVKAAHRSTEPLKSYNINVLRQKPFRV